ncbi:MAG: DNA/RNA non-specific endonuclease, partial [Alistipes sp.]
SICYDRTKKVSQWVAYPLHTCYTTPKVGRTDAWAYDPNTFAPVIPESDQQYVIESYRTGYARGHQCPSADRYSTVPTNEQTFYATNMMPQDGGFNGGIWASLESKVRDNICNDTLYVVTGTYFANERTTTDRKGNIIGLPSNCWKVLLRTKSGSTKKRIEDCKADELIGIGFWFANDKSNGNPLPSYSKSIAEIEKQTGFTFFHNLAADAVAVKSQNDPSAWNIR